MGAKDVSNPDFQIGEGCLVDQLLGRIWHSFADLDILQILII